MDADVERIIGMPAAAAARAIAPSPSGWAIAWAAIGATAIGRALGRAQERAADLDLPDIGQDPRDEPDTRAMPRRSRPG